ncbi:hypothetical protein FOA52_005293 [Chlamydomonas sp. UWO 241]|nr:hypothetical protein FOA52_005293 [Chlamydomonas sp. UWO 241]
MSRWMCMWPSHATDEPAPASKAEAAAPSAAPRDSYDRPPSLPARSSAPVRFLQDAPADAAACPSASERPPSSPHARISAPGTSSDGTDAPCATAMSTLSSRRSVDARPNLSRVSMSSQLATANEVFARAQRTPGATSLGLAGRPTRAAASTSTTGWASAAPDRAAPDNRTERPTERSCRLSRPWTARLLPTRTRHGGSD